MSGSVIYVESTQKLKLYQRVITENNLSFSAFATCGRLTNITWQDASLDPGAFKPVRPLLHKTIVKTISTASQIYIATDPDDLGELIASEIQAICVRVKIPWKRVMTHQLAGDDIINAINHATSELNHSAINRAKLFGYYDFHLSKILSQPESNIIIGRCQTPLLHLFSQEKAITHEHLLSRGELTQSHYGSALFHLPEPTTPSVTETPLKGCNLTTLCSKLLSRPIDHSLTELATLLETIYLDEKLSYVRTSEEELTQDDEQNLEHYYRSQGAQWLTRLPLPQNVSDNHSPIIPLKPLDEYACPTEKAIFEILTAHYRAMTVNNRQTIIDDGVLWESPNARQSTNELLTNYEQSKTVLQSRPLSKELSILQTLEQNNLCQPSTVLRTSDRVKPYLIQSEQLLRLTGNALRQLAVVKQRFSPLLDLSFHQMLNDRLTVDEPLSDQQLIDHIKSQSTHILPNTVSPKISVFNKPTSSNQRGNIKDRSL